MTCTCSAVGHGDTPDYQQLCHHTLSDHQLQLASKFLRWLRLQRLMQLLQLTLLLWQNRVWQAILMSVVA